MTAPTDRKVRPWRLGWLIGVAAALCGHGAAAQPARVTGYQLSLARCRPSSGGVELVGLRRLLIDGRVHHLVVDPVTLSTALTPASGLQVESLPWQELRRAFEATPYMRAVARAEGRRAELQDAGIVHSLPPEQGVVLTVDLCPSRRPLDRTLFAQLIDGFREVERPVPVAISITGVWMLEHPEDLRWLIERVDSGDLAVTWINHSYHHAFDPRRPLSRDFLLMPGIDIEAEVLETEVAMIEHAMLPSVFFRFPGLVSDESVFERVISFGLIPTGSDAWLAKGQPATPGSIVLIHGNGNEPAGVSDFLELMRRERGRIKSHDWLLFDLRSSSSGVAMPPGETRSGAPVRH
jgi:hypothetical protein